MPYAVDDYSLVPPTERTSRREQHARSTTEASTASEPGVREREAPWQRSTCATRAPHIAHHHHRIRTSRSPPPVRPPSDLLPMTISRDSQAHPSDADRQRLSNDPCAACSLGKPTARTTPKYLRPRRRQPTLCLASVEQKQRREQRRVKARATKGIIDSAGSGCKHAAGWVPLQSFPRQVPTLHDRPKPPPPHIGHRIGTAGATYFYAGAFFPK